MTSAVEASGGKGKLDTLQEVLFWATLVAFLAGFFLWQARCIDGPGLNAYDEGVHLVVARLVGSGYFLYSQIAYHHPPVLAYSLAGAFAVFGKSVVVACIVVLVYSLVGLLAVALIARELEGRLAGLSAPLMLAISPVFFAVSKSVLPEASCMSLAALSLFFALRSWRAEGKVVWLALSGLALATSLMLKLLMLPVVPVIGFAVLIGAWHRRQAGHPSPKVGGWTRLGLCLAVWVVCLILPIVLCVAAFDKRAMYEHIVGTLADFRRAYPLDIVTNWHKTLKCLLMDNGGLAGIAFLGAFASFQKRSWRGILVAAWQFVALISLLIHTPFHTHYMVLLLPALVSLGGIGFAAFVERGLGLLGSRSWGTAAGWVVALVPVILYATGLSRIIAADGELLWRPQRQRDREAAHFLSEITSSNALVVTDGPWIAFQADRNAVPPLSDTSHGTIKSGHLTAAKAIAATRAYSPQAILFWDGRRLWDDLPAYVEWVADNYHLIRWYGSKRFVYVPLNQPAPAEYTFNGQILFLGYDPDSVKLRKDGTLTISLGWRALRPVEGDYRIYLKLINGAYHVWGEQDARPFWDGFPTNEWEVDQIVFDPREIPVLPGTPPGSYQLAVSLYDPFQGQTLELDSGSELLLEPIEIPCREPPPLTSLDIEHPQEGVLGGKVRFLGYNMESGLRPGDNIHLTLFWQCLEKMDQDYTVFIHLIDEKQNIWGQKDNPPVDGFYCTSQWEVGEVVRDQYDMAISPETPPGEYQLEVGMYLAETGERLSVFQGGQEISNRVLLASQITVK